MENKFNKNFNKWYKVSKELDHFAEMLDENLEQSVTKDLAMSRLQECRTFAHLNIMRDKDRIYHPYDIYREEENMIPISDQPKEENNVKKEKEVKQPPPPIEYEPQYEEEDDDIPFPEVEQSRQPQQTQHEEDDDELPF